MTDQILTYLLSFPLVIISLTFHEFAHAFVADRLGDSTPREYGRLTLNPLKHLDPIGFLFMLFAHIGWAKPVPINLDDLRKPMQGQFLIALAGPASNMLLAGITLILLKLIVLILPFEAASVLFTPFFLFVMINISLGLFNLIPFPPFDGGNIVGSFIPEEHRDSWNNIRNIAPFILLIFIIPGSPLFAIFNSFWYNITDIVSRTLITFIIR